MNLKDIQRDIWHNKLNKEFCLLYGEVAEAHEAWKKKKDDLGEELADVAIYLMGLSEMLGFDLEGEIMHKVTKNEKRVYKNVDEKIVPELLDESNILSKEIIEDYDYIQYKNDIKYVISLIKNNALYHITDRARLTLFISEDLKAYTKIENNNKINYNFI